MVFRGKSYELLQKQVVLNTHLMLETNLSLGLPVALNKHGRPVAGPITEQLRDNCHLITPLS